MNILMILALFVVAIFTGCTTPQTKRIHVLTAPSEVTVKSFEVEDGDKVLCDTQGCKVIR